MTIHDYTVKTLVRLCGIACCPSLYYIHMDKNVDLSFTNILKDI